MSNSVLLDLLLDSGYAENEAVLKHCVEVKKILIASINPAKNKKQCTEHETYSHNAKNIFWVQIPAAAKQTSLCKVI